MLQKYFDGGGRALILFDAFGARAETGWEELLRQFGVRVGFDTVRDPQSVSLAGGQDMQVNHFAKHPITQPMVVAESAGVHLILPRSITPLPRNNTATELTRIDPLFFTSTSGTLHEPLLGRTGSGNGERLLSEIRTNQPMAVAIERGGLPGVGAAQGGTSRMVVVGDSLFLNNRMLGSAANGVFATYAVNWLADRSVLLSDIGPKPYQDYRLSMTRKDRLVLAWVLLGAMPGGVLFLGFMVWLRRRS